MRQTHLLYHVVTDGSALLVVHWRGGSRLPHCIPLACSAVLTASTAQQILHMTGTCSGAGSIWGRLACISLGFVFLSSHPAPVHAVRGGPSIDSGVQSTNRHECVL